MINYYTTNTDISTEPVDEESGVIRMTASNQQMNNSVTGYYGSQDYEESANWSFNWKIISHATDKEKAYLLSYGSQPFNEILTTLEQVSKIQRKYRERVAGVFTDANALTALDLLNRETSVRWEDLESKMGLACFEVCRSISLLAAAEMCDVGHSRVRISAIADRILLESE